MSQKTLKGYTKLPQQQSIEKKEWNIIKQRYMRKSSAIAVAPIAARLAARRKMLHRRRVMTRAARESRTHTRRVRSPSHTRPLPRPYARARAHSLRKDILSYSASWCLKCAWNPTKRYLFLRKKNRNPRRFLFKKWIWVKRIFFFFKSEISRLTQDTSKEIRASSARSQWAAGP